MFDFLKSDEVQIGNELYVFIALLGDTLFVKLKK